MTSQDKLNLMTNLTPVKKVTTIYLAQNKQDSLHTAMTAYTQSCVISQDIGSNVHLKGR